jgi:porin
MALGLAQAKADPADANNQGTSDITNTNIIKHKKIAKKKVHSSPHARTAAVPVAPAVPVAATDAQLAAWQLVEAGHGVNSPEVLAALERNQGIKGTWDIPPPNLTDSILQNDNGFRSTLDKYGFGILFWNNDLFEVNTLNTPSIVPYSAPYAPCTIHNYYSGVCQGKHVYYSSRPDWYTLDVIYLTYDLSRWGVPDGQIVIGGEIVRISDPAFIPNAAVVNEVSYHQTLFDKKLELTFGTFDGGEAFAGAYVGGNFVSTFGFGSAINTELGQNASMGLGPGAMALWHITDNLYNQAMVQRSLVENGPNGVIPDTLTKNPIGLRFNGPPGTRELFRDELGYKQQATPHDEYTWLRFGALYNNSNFPNEYQALTGGVVEGNSGVYFLADRQLWQSDPSSPYTAYRGIYAGASVFYAQPDRTPIYEYFEGRVYGIGLLDWRPLDMISLVYGHQGVSPGLVGSINSLNASLAPVGGLGYTIVKSTNSVTLSYLANLSRGITLDTALQYTDKPSVTYLTNEGSSLTFLVSLTTVF